MRILIIFAPILSMLSFPACAVKESHVTKPTTPDTTVPVPTDDISITVTLPSAPEPLVTEPAIRPLSILPGSYLDTFADPVTESLMDYYLHIPENATEHMPLIIFLHGDGEVGNPYILKDFGMIKSARDIYGNAFPFIGLSPSTDIKSWIDGDLPETLKALIDNVIKLYTIDSERIIITGHSRGAIGVWNMISIYGDFFAAAVPVSSAHQKGHIDFEIASKVSVWSFAGNIGENELWNHKWLQYNKNVIINKGGWAEFTVLPGCDHGETATAAFTEDTFRWMLEQSNNKEK